MLSSCEMDLFSDTCEYVPRPNLARLHVNKASSILLYFYKTITGYNVELFNQTVFDIN